MRRVRVLAVLMLSATALGPSPAAAEDTPLRGVALVIGESDYDQLQDLENPKRDARAMDDLLDTLGFDVLRVLDGDADKLRDEIADFVDEARDADVALVYYSGHGVELGGANFLVPTDTDLSSPQAAGSSLVAVSGMLDELAKTVPVTIVLLDACRTNSFPAGTTIQLPGTDAPVEVDAVGLEAMRGPTPLARPDVGPENLGMVIGFAASPGQAALDGEPGNNSPYAAALLKHFGAGGYSFGDLMTMVTEEVYLETKARQQPWVNSSLRRVLNLASPADQPTGDAAAVSNGRRKLLLSIANAPQPTRKYVEALASGEDVSLAQLYGMYSALGIDPNADPATLEAQLRAGAERLKALQAAPVRSVPRTDPELRRLDALSATADEQGALDVALQLSQKASARADELAVTLAAEDPATRDQHLELGATYAGHAKAAMLTFDFETAAAMWGQAYGQVAKWDDEAAVTYKWQEGNNLADLGRARSDDALLRKAIEAYEVAAGVKSNSELTKARIETSIGDVLWTMGSHSATTDALSRAIDAYNAVMDTYDTLESEGIMVPDDAWARVYTSAGVAFLAVADRDPGTENLQRANDFFEAALTHVDPIQNPLGWAQIKGNLGSLYVTFGDRSSDATHYYAKGVDADLSVIARMPRDVVPLQWATAQNNLGIALARVGEVSGDAGKLREAIAAFDLALEERTRGRVPSDWAATQDNKASALATIGMMNSDPSALQDAIAVFDAMLEVRTRENGPLAWAQGMRNRGLAKKQLGVLADSVNWLEQAIADYRDALEVLDAGESPQDWGQTQTFLGLAAMELAVRTERRSDYEMAYDALVNAYNLYYEADPGYADQIGSVLSDLEAKLGT